MRFSFPSIARTARHALLALTLTTLAGATACGGSSAVAPVRADVNGSWQGSFNTTSSSVVLSTILTESAGTVTGNGTMRTGTSTVAFTVSGSFSGSNISLTLASPGYTASNFTGTVSGTSMTGTLNGSGFVNAAVTLTRQ